MTEQPRGYTEPVHGPIEEAELEPDELGGLRRTGPGWFVVNAAEAAWETDQFTTMASFQGTEPFGQYGFNLDVLQRGKPSTSYHREYWEDETFFVLSGECLLLVEGQECPMRAGDLFHSPAGTAHAFVGAGEGPCAMITVGARNVTPDGAQWGIYEHDAVAAKHGACVAQDTPEPAVAYADRPDPVPATPAWSPRDARTD